MRLTAEDGYQAQRSYSIASAPELDRVELTVELVDDGEVSPYLVEELRPGDELELRGPIGGHFVWDVRDGGPLALVGGGSGLVPLMAMLRHRAARASAVEAHLLASARTPQDALWRDELAALGPREGLSVAWTFTRATPEGWDGFARRVDAEMLAAVVPPPSAVPRVLRVRADGLRRDGRRPARRGRPRPRSVRAERFGPTGGGTP